MFEGLGPFLMVISIVLLGEDGATNMFVVGRGAASAEDRGEGLDIIMFEVVVESWFCL